MKRQEASRLLEAYWQARWMLENRSEQPSVLAKLQSAEEACLDTMLRNESPLTARILALSVTQLQQTVAELRADLSSEGVDQLKAYNANLRGALGEMRAEQERHIDALKRIDAGPHHTMANDEVASWARHIAAAALASPPAAEEPSNKGTYGGECNRASCSNVPATWKHRDIPRHYCQPCGMWINENNSDCDPPLCGPVSGETA